MVLRRPFKTEQPEWDRHRGVTLSDDEAAPAPAPAPAPAALINATASGRLAAVKARLETESSATR
jgi:hypothetical protein